MHHDLPASTQPRRSSAWRLRWKWRRLRPEELDHELIWLAVSVTSAALAWAWLRWKMPLPVCTFRAATGCACPTCGATRAVTQLFHGNLPGALHFNPLVTSAALGLLVFDLYAAVVLALRLPRLRADTVSPRTATTLRLMIGAAILANWAWLVWAGI